MNIAVCDDEENIRIYIKKLIEEQDVSCQVMEFSSGEELLRFWGQEDREQLDILFLDISMDGTDGMETAEQIRDWKEEREEVLWGSLPLLIFVTGYPEYMPKAFSVNAFQYLVKPVDETVKHSSLPEILMEHIIHSRWMNCIKHRRRNIWQKGKFLTRAGKRSFFPKWRRAGN